MEQNILNEQFDPSLHLILLDNKDRTPIIYSSEEKKESTLVAITENGMISFFPVEEESVFLDGEKIGKTFPFVNEIKNRIEERFPDDKDIFGNTVNQYLTVGVMYGNQEKGWAKFIFEVWGFKDHFFELDSLYNKLSSIGGMKIGCEEYNEVQEYLSTDPRRKWINELIFFLKEQLNWTEYVNNSIVNIISEESSGEKYAISFCGGDFKVRTEPEKNIWCIDNHCQPCVIVLPQAAYKLIDSFVTEYSEKNLVAATIGCKNLSTENPLFMPVIMDIEVYNNLYVPLSKYMEKKLTPPEKLAKEFLNKIEFAKHDLISQTVKLWRQAKDLSKGDLFTRNSEDKRIEIYVTHLLKTEKPYSLKEVYLLKLKSLFKF